MQLTHIESSTISSIFISLSCNELFWTRNDWIRKWKPFSSTGRSTKLYICQTRSNYNVPKITFQSFVAHPIWRIITWRIRKGTDASSSFQILVIDVLRSRLILISSIYHIFSMLVKSAARTPILYFTEVCFDEWRVALSSWKFPNTLAITS